MRIGYLEIINYMQLTYVFIFLHFLGLRPPWPLGSFWPGTSVQCTSSETGCGDLDFTSGICYLRTILGNATFLNSLAPRWRNKKINGSSLIPHAEETHLVAPCTIPIRCWWSSTGGDAGELNRVRQVCILFISTETLCMCAVCGSSHSVSQKEPFAQLSLKFCLISWRPNLRPAI